MNIFRSLIGKVWQDSNAAEVVKISSGQLYLIRPGNIRSSRECIYNEAMATIRRVPSVEHNFQLVITRVYEEGDQELLGDEDETDEERVFLISEELEFRSGETEGEPTLVWRDLEGDIDECYEFVASGTNNPTLAFFETCMYRAMYERKYKTSANATRDEDLDEFIWQPPKVAKPKSSKTARKSSQRSSDTTPTSPAPVKTLRNFDKNMPKSLAPVSTGEAELYCWDPVGNQFVLHHEPSQEMSNTYTVQIGKRSGPEYEYWLIVSSKDGPIIAHRVKPEMNQRWSRTLTSFTWNHLGDDGKQSSWCVRFLAEEPYAKFLAAFTQALWESLHQVSWDKMKADEQRYISSANEDVEMLSVEDEEEQDEEAVQDVLGNDEEDEEEEEEEEEEDESNSQGPFTGGRNNQLIVGYKGDRSYVTRGNNIGVFSHTSDEQVKYYGTLSNITTPKGAKLVPDHVMLHNQDTKMIIKNPAAPHSLFSLDIEHGKVVEEWKVHDDITVDHIAPDHKFAQTTPNQTIVGISHNALFRIDPRISGNKLVDSQYKQYAGKNAFSGVATTAKGGLAVASAKGDIKLFDTIGKIAKTALPPLGDPVLGIDVTADGRWIVATTKAYLLLIDTLIGEGKYRGSLGFDRSFPAAAKPIPRRLQLRNEHVSYMDHDISFTPARFNQGEGQVENAIITSTGQYVVAWDFEKVKKGKLGSYDIKKYEDYVVQDNFKFGDDKHIIVALQNNVLAINKAHLKRPTRKSLGVDSRKSKSDIVNSPFLRFSVNDGNRDGLFIHMLLRRKKKLAGLPIKDVTGDFRQAHYVVQQPRLPTDPARRRDDRSVAVPKSRTRGWNSVEVERIDDRKNVHSLGYSE